MFQGIAIGEGEVRTNSCLPLLLSTNACLGHWGRGRSLKGKWDRGGTVREIEQKNASFLSDWCPERAVEGEKEWKWKEIEKVVDNQWPLLV